MVAQVNSQAVKILEVADDPRLSKGTKEFLKVLNSGGVALEKLTALEARQVLVDAQTSVSVDLSGIEESQKTITADGYSITLNIVEQLKGLPPALIVVAESDILHDEGTAYGRKLDEAGVEVTTVQYNGMIHDFGLLNGLADLPQTRSLFVQAAAQLKKYLQ